MSSKLRDGVTQTTSNSAQRGAARISPGRQVALVVHRYVGLVMTSFLVVAGLTGSLLAFYDELDAAVSPALLTVTPPSPDTEPLHPVELRDRVQAAVGAKAPLRSVPLRHEPERARSFWVHGEDDAWREHFADPYTGQVLGSRVWGDLSEGIVNLMPFVYRLHYSLALGDVGTFLFGLVALLWTLDCFVGAYLTFPPPRRQKGGQGWLRRWVPAWLVKAGKTFSLVFTWHRASGLWVWSMLLVFAWSAVGLNLRDVYTPVMRATLGMQPHAHDTLPQLPKPHSEPALDMRAAYERGRRLMAEKAEREGFEVLSERWLYYADDHGAYSYSVFSTLDVSEKFADTALYFDGQTGREIAFDAPTGFNAGNTVSTWLFSLHFGAVHAWGWPYRVVVCLMGLGVTLLSVTGAWIWAKKRLGRVAKKQRRARRAVANPLAPSLSGSSHAE